MKINKSTIAVTFATLMIGSVSINPVSAAVKSQSWTDLSATTHHAVSAIPNQHYGHTGYAFNHSDISAITHTSAPAGVQTMAKESYSGYSRNDITAITHAYN